MVVMSKDAKSAAGLDDKTVSLVLAPVSPSKEEARRKRVSRDIWGKLRKFGRSIPFMEDVVAAYFCAMDERTPTAARATLFAALAYFIAPIDIVPDMLALIGLGDDIAILTAVLMTLRTHMSDDHRKQARRALADPPDAKGPIIDG